MKRNTCTAVLDGKTHVNVASVSPAAVYLSAQVTTHTSPKVKEEQSKPSTVSSSRSALPGHDKALYRWDKMAWRQGGKKAIGSTRQGGRCDVDGHDCHDKIPEK